MPQDPKVASSKYMAAGLSAIGVSIPFAVAVVIHSPLWLILHFFTVIVTVGLILTLD